VRELMTEALADGSAAHRLRRAAEDEDLLAGVDLMVAETRGAPVPHAVAPAGTTRARRAGPVAGGAGT
jgi:carboxylate-amine ligase